MNPELIESLKNINIERIQLLFDEMKTPDISISCTLKEDPTRVSWCGPQINVKISGSGSNEILKVIQGGLAGFNHWVSSEADSYVIHIEYLNTFLLIRH